MIEHETYYKFYESGIARLDPIDRAEWTAGLRSGKYAQGKNMLKTPEGKYCCLGVRCDIKGIPEYNALKDVKLGESSEYAEAVIPIFGHPQYGAYSHLPASGAIPYEASSRIFGAFTGTEVVFECKRPEVEGWAAYTLPALNDDVGLTFDQIADVIDYFL